MHRLDVKVLEPGEPRRAEVLYFAGCTAALDPSLQHIAQNTVRLLQKAGVNFGVLGDEEVCCGSVMLRVGERDLARELAEKNLSLFRGIGVKTIVTSCAGCYKTLRQDYPSYGDIQARVVHTSEFVRELYLDGKLQPTNQTKLRVTYHDPCHLGRHCGLYDAPRKMIEALPGVSLEEMTRNRENTWCCGAGGGVRSAFPDWALESSRIRVQEAEETGSSHLVTTCPFCLQNLTTAVQAGNTPLEVMDLTDLLARIIS